jgi:splicing factor 3B subunit 1
MSADDAEPTKKMQIDPDDEEMIQKARQGRREYTATQNILDEQEVTAQMDITEDQSDPFALRKGTIGGRQSDYQQRQYEREISPERSDPFANGGKTPARGDEDISNFAKVVQAKTTKENEKQLRQDISKGIKDGEFTEKEVSAAMAEVVSDNKRKKRRRWDATPDDVGQATLEVEEDLGPAHLAKTPAIAPRWDATPGHGTSEDSGTESSRKRRNRWDETPAHITSGTAGENGVPLWGETPRALSGADDDEALIAKSKGVTPSKRRSRWDATPADMGMTPSLDSFGTPKMGETPKFDMGGATPQFGSMTPSGATPVGMMAAGFQTPAPNLAANLSQMTPEQFTQWKVDKEIDDRNKPLTDLELDAMFPPGYKIMEPPASYVPIRTPSRKLLETPTPMAGDAGLGQAFQIQEVNEQMTEAQRAAQIGTAQPTDSELPLLKPDDMQYFDKLLIEVDEKDLSPEEKKEREIMKILLKIKNGTPPMRKSAMRQITTRTRWFGAGPLFNQILPLLMSPTLEDQERHLLVKVIDRILYKLDDLVRPYVHKILVVIEPLLIDEDYYARVEGREIISNLAKAAGLATMISVMRPDIDNMDEYVRNTTARAFAVVASALGIPALLPFLKAVCRSKKSWQARHTGIKIIQQIAILMGCAILPHLRGMVEIIETGLEDDQQKVRTITALALAALAEAATPYGIESFDSVLKPLWKGIRQHRGKGLAAFLKAIGYIIPLMDPEYANYYTREVMIILIREFQTPDEEMKKIVLKVVKQCVGTEGVEPDYVRSDIVPPFFQFFWTPRMALDKRNYRQMIDTTVEIACKVGVVEIVSRIVDELKDENEQYRKMVLETIEKILLKQGADEIDERLEEQLIDGILYSYQEQTTEDPGILHGFGVVINALGARCKQYLPQICGTLLWRLNNKSARIRQQAADLIARIAVVMRLCDEEKLMGHLGVVLYEYLGEEYPEVLGSILGALKAIVNVIGMHKMTPPIKDLLPRLTPILKNRHEKVQENCIDLVGRIADRGAEFVSAREWMRICFDLLDLLKAQRKSIRRACVNTFGYIAKAIGPHDVMATLLNNLKVQERQLRVCTTVAIAIVAETCAPFTVLPGLINEYRVPEMNVQNGVLKALSWWVWESFKVKYTNRLISCFSYLLVIFHYLFNFGT